MPASDGARTRADRRTLAVIVSSVALVVLAVSIGVALVIMNQIRAEQARPSASGPAALFGDYADGRPIIVSHEGIGAPDGSLPTVTEYFDYSCPGCVQLATSADAELIAGARAGEYNLAFAAVSSHNAPWNPVAAGASIIVAKDAPDQWEAFHEALIAYYDEALRRGDGTVVTDAGASLEQVRVIAARIGVPQALIESFPAAGIGQYYLDASSAKWQESTAEGRTGFATPELVVGTVRAELPDFSASTVMDEVRSLLAR